MREEVAAQFAKAGCRSPFEFLKVRFILGASRYKVRPFFNRALHLPDSVALSESFACFRCF